MENQTETVWYDNYHYAEIGQDADGWWANGFSVEPSDGSADWKGGESQLKSRDEAVECGMLECFGCDPSDWPRGWE